MWHMTRVITRIQTQNIHIVKVGPSSLSHRVCVLNNYTVIQKFIRRWKIVLAEIAFHWLLSQLLSQFILLRQPNVFTVGPTLYKCYTNVLCLLGTDFHEIVHLFCRVFVLVNWHISWKCVYKTAYYRFGNIREFLIFANFARRTNSRIQESREYYYYNSITKEKEKSANSKLREKSPNQKFAKI